ncbi:MAG: rhomboid family intramembrane serine protease [Limnochordia bacterium]|jgi:membrane associated rhomboid family serine protease
MWKSDATRQRSTGTWFLIAVTVFIFIIDIASQRLPVEWGAKTAAIWYGQYWRLFTATFLHADLRHLLFNMYALFVFGRVVESILGGNRFFVVYLFSGAVGFLFSLIITPDAPAVGASAALFGLIGYTLHYRIRRLPRQYMPMDRALLQILGINLIIGLLVPNIDLMGHVGGLVGGILAASIVGMPSTYGNERYDRSKALISLVMTAAIAFVSLKPIVTADLLRPILPPAAQWLDNRVGGYFTPLRPVGFGLYWYSPSLNQWSPAGKVVMALSNGWVDLGVFWRWETGIGETGIIPYSVTWRAIEGSRGQTLHVDEDTVTQVDANKAMIYRRSAQRLFPGTYEIVVEVAGRNVARRRVTVR